MPAVTPLARLRALRVATAASATLATVATSVVLAAPAAHAAGTEATHMAVTPTSQIVPAGQHATLHVHVVGSTGSNAAGGVVRLYDFHGGTWHYYGAKYTDANGTATITPRVTASMYWRYRFAGTSRFAPSTSGNVVVHVSHPSTLGSRAVTEASRHYGAPYQWGATGPSRFDCSGFTLYVYGRLGRSLPHSSSAQYSVVHHVAKSQAQPGDLIFFYNSSGIYHVGIYAGHGEMWAATHTGDIVRHEAIWSSAYYVGRVG